MSLGGFRMSYENMSDFEINKAVAEKCGLKVTESQYPELQDDVLIINDKMEIEFSSSVNYCNSWEDMGPIILDNDISVIRDMSTNDVWLAIPKGWFSTNGFESSIGNDLSCIHTNPLRAAAIVYLMIGEEK
jgi:hypothetical protein